MIDKISNLHLIKSSELRDNINKIYDEVSEIIANTESVEKAEPLIRKMLYNHVLGIGKPISICDSVVYHNSLLNHISVELLIDYRVTCGYKPYQKLDNSIELGFIIYRSDAISYIRDKKIDSIID